jgi:hypothetical protein
MAIELHPTPEDNVAIAALANRWKVPREEAILRAVREASESHVIDSDLARAYERVTAPYRPALNRLGRL